MRESMAVIADAVRADAPALDVSEMIKCSGETASQSMESVTDVPLSGQLTSALIRYVHRLLLPSDTYAGQFRQTQVWLVDPTGRSSVDLECPSWDKVPVLIKNLLEEWNRSYPEIAASADLKAVSKIARFFHKLLAIHPFLDGNGRLARALLSLQARELFGLEEDLLIERGADYYAALKSADMGNFDELERLILAAQVNTR